MPSAFCLCNRRDLLRGSLALAAIPPACCTTPEIPPECVTFTAESVRIDLKATGGVLAPGTAVRVVNADRGVNLLLVRVDEQRYVAASLKCTHGGAPLTYNEKHKTISCTSFGHSEFDFEGAVLRGPAPRTLPTYQIVRSADQLEIRMAAKA